MNKTLIPLATSNNPINSENNYINDSYRPKKILIEANIIIDILLERSSEYSDDLENIYELILEKKIQAYATEIGIKYTWLFISSFYDKEIASKKIDELLNLFNICSLDKINLNDLEEYSSRGKLLSLDSSLLLSFAHAEKVDAIITSKVVECVNYYDQINDDDGSNSYIPLLSPDKFYSWYTIHDETEFQEIKESYRQQLDKQLTKRIDFKDKAYCIGDWSIVCYEVFSAKDNNGTQGTITIQSNKTGERIREYGSGKGSIDVLCKALKKAIKPVTNIPDFTLLLIKTDIHETGTDAEVEASVVISSEEKLYHGTDTHTDSIKALMNALIKAVNNIHYEQEFSLQKKEKNKSEICLRARIIEKLMEQGKVNFAKTELQKINFAEANLSGIDLRNANLEGANLSNANLEGANLSDANLKGANLSDANLEGASLSDANLEGAKLSGANLESANFSDANLEDANFTDTNLDNVNFSGANLQEANLSGADLEGANLSGADLEEANLSGANLEGANLSSANLEGANLSYANLEGANLSDANLEGANLSDSYLVKANLSYTDLEGANLSGAKLEDAKINGANLEDANLSNANLFHVNMENTRLIKANLSKATLSKAFLTDSTLIGANLSQANLDNISLTDVDLNHCILSVQLLNLCILENLSLDKDNHISSQFNTCS